jgi:thioredoxin-like negative regulator of GroEL
MALALPALMAAACGGEMPAVTPATISFAPATDRPTFIFFYAAECELCPQMQPVVDGIRAQYADRVLFAFLDAASAGEVMARYDQTGYPSYVLLRKDGSVAWSFLGARTPAQFAAELEKTLAGR